MKRGFDDFEEDHRNIHNKSIELSGVDSFYFSEHKVKELIKDNSFDYVLQPVFFII